MIKMQAEQKKFYEFLAQALGRSRVYGQMLAGIADADRFRVMMRDLGGQIQLRPVEYEYGENVLARVIRRTVSEGQPCRESMRTTVGQVELFCVPVPELGDGGFVLFDSKGVGESFAEDAVQYLRTKVHSVCALRAQLEDSFGRYEEQTRRLKSEVANLCFDLEEGQQRASREADARLEEAQNLLEIIKRSRNKLYKLIDNTSVGIVSVDREKKLVNVNAYFGKIAQESDVSRLVGEPICRFFCDSEDGFCSDDCLIRQVFETGRAQSTLLSNFAGQDDRDFSVEVFPVGEGDQVAEVGLIFSDVTDLLSTQKNYEDLQRVSRSKFRDLKSLQQEYTSMGKKFRSLYGKHAHLSKEFESLKQRHQELQTKYQNALTVMQDKGGTRLMAEKAAATKKIRELAVMLNKQRDTLNNLLAERGQIAESMGEGYQRYMHQVSTFVNRVDNMNIGDRANSRQVEDIYQMMQRVTGQMDDFGQQLMPFMRMVRNLRRLVDQLADEMGRINYGELAEAGSQSAPSAPASGRSGRSGAANGDSDESRPFDFEPTQAPADVGSEDGIQMFRLSV